MCLAFKCDNHQIQKQKMSANVTYIKIGKKVKTGRRKQRKKQINS
jgi:hypothetical protein